MFAEFVSTYGMEILVSILGIIGTVLGFIAKSLVKKFLNDKTKQSIAKTCVLFVEQVFKHLHGEEKLTAALNRAAELLTEKGINCTVHEMETLIEAAVAEFNEAFRKPAIEVAPTE